MQTLPKKPEKKPRKQFTNQNAVESLESIVGDFKKSLKEDVVKGTAKSAKDSFKDDLAKGAVNEAWDELLGINHDQATKGHEGVRLDQGELSEGAELDLEALKEETIEVTEMGRQFSSEVIHAGKKAEAQQSQEIEVRMQEILIEIKKLTESSEELKDEIDVVSIEQAGEDPGVYHVNFLEKILSNLRDLRLNVEDSLAWFSSLRSKKAARQYNSMAKKHGTSFTLSGERQVATQVG